MSKREFNLQRFYRISGRVVIVITILSLVLFFYSFVKYMQVLSEPEKMEKEWSKSEFNVSSLEYLRLPAEKKKQVDEKKQEYMLRTMMAKKEIPLWSTRMYIFCITAWIFGSIFIGGNSLFRYLVSHHQEKVNSHIKEDEKSE